MNRSKISFCLIIPEYTVYLSDPAFRNNVLINSVVNIFFSISSIILNSSVIWVIFSHQRLWTPYYLTLLSLAITDFTAGLLAQPLHIARILLLVLEERAICTLDVATVAAGYTLLAVSFFTVSYVTYERYLAVFYPFLHEQRCTRNKSCRCLIAIWFVGTVYGGIGALPYEQARILFMIMVSAIGTVCLFGNGIAYVRIFVTANRIRRKIKQEQKRFTGDEKKIVKAANAAKTTCIVVTSLFIFYGPAFLSTAIADSVALFPAYFNIWAYTFMLMNSAVNPLVYCYFCRDIGDKMKLLWKCPTSLKSSDRRMANSFMLESRN